MNRALFVLLVTDRLACLALPGGEIVHAGSDWEDIRASLAADPHRPVRVVLDCAEQVYEQATIKLRNPWDRRQLLSRKQLALSPLASISGIRRLARHHYLLTGGISAVGLQEALQLLASTGNPMHDISLLTMELGAYFAQVFPALTRGWSIVTLDSKLAGFRQIVLCNGETVFGRVLPTEPTVENWRREIGTILAYLPRLGLPRNTPIALAANLEQVPLGDFPGVHIGDVFCLPVKTQDVLAGFLQWHGGQRQPILGVARQHWQLERSSKTILRAACCLTAIMTLLGTAGIIHLHRETVAVVTATAGNGRQQNELASRLNAAQAENGSETQYRLALQLHGDLQLAADPLPQVRAALGSLPLELGLQTIQYQHTPFMVRAGFVVDPAAQLPILKKQLSGLSIAQEGNDFMVSRP